MSYAIYLMYLIHNEIKVCIWIEDILNSRSVTSQTLKVIKYWLRLAPDVGNYFSRSEWDLVENRRPSQERTRLVLIGHNVWTHKNVYKYYYFFGYHNLIFELGTNELNPKRSGQHSTLLYLVSCRTCNKAPKTYFRKHREFLVTMRYLTLRIYLNVWGIALSWERPSWAYMSAARSGCWGWRHYKPRRRYLASESDPTHGNSRRSNPVQNKILIMK